MTVTARVINAVPDPQANDDPIVQVITHDRAYDAHRMHVAGHDWTEIAAATGFATAKTAAMAVTAYLQKTGLQQAPQRREMALQTELDRLDALQYAYWHKALDGDYKAALVVLKILTMRTKILGLERPDLQVSQPRT